MNIHQSKELWEYNSLFKELDDIYHSIALKLGLSDSAFTILYTICESGDGCSQKDICRQSFISKQTINSAIRKLEADQLIQLEKKGKGRELYIHLTDKGKLLAREKIEPVMEMEIRAFARMPERDLKELLRLTRDYVSRFHQEAQSLLSSEVTP